ncbi:MAG: ADP-dependent NAD(P)H-hydrate dehydratase [Cetobacterium sp.]
MHFIDSNLIEQVFIPRKKESYKGDFGYTLILCGSKGMTGGGIFSSMGAVKSGFALTTLGTYSDCFNIFSIKLNEVMIINLDEFDALKNVNKFSSIVFGCGFAVNEKNENLLLNLLENYKNPLVIDANGISLLSKNNNLESLKNRKYPTILTLHYGEFSKLVNLEIDYIKKNRIEIGKDFTKNNKEEIEFKKVRYF